MQICSEIMFFMLFGSTILFTLAPLFVPQIGKKRFTVLIIARFLGVCILAQTLRVLTFLLTVLPGPNYHCRPHSAEYNPPRNYKDILFVMDAFKGCGDLVFSSHTIFVLLCSLTLHKYTDHRWVRRIVWTIAFIFGFVVVAARKHYSIDILIAWYTVPLLWIVYDMYFPDKLPHELVGKYAPVKQETPLHGPQKAKLSIADLSV